ncbi:MAG: hypothetical protein GY816_14630 [Cytophagales bacterium]|nr:hypothetical protein [Cytophagales bacterium]
MEYLKNEEEYPCSSINQVPAKDKSMKSKKEVMKELQTSLPDQPLGISTAQSDQQGEHKAVGAPSY